MEEKIIQICIQHFNAKVKKINFKKHEPVLEVSDIRSMLETGKKKTDFWKWFCEIENVIIRVFKREYKCLSYFFIH